MAESNSSAKEQAKATLAGGCFWCMEPPFDEAPGVSATIVGYTGGKVENPTYQQITTGRTGHREAVEIHYDPAQITFPQLLEIFWSTIDPHDAGGQYVDRGPQYTTAIYYHHAEQKQQAEASVKALEEKTGKQVATEILPAVTFYPAEDYHQDFYQKNENHYQRYKAGSGRK
jgi:methionine-S-sulfoxide reductase